MSRENLSTPTSRRRFLTQAATVGALAAGSLAGPRPSAAAAASELRILFPGGSWQEWFNTTFVKPFEQSAKVQTVWKLGSVVRAAGDRAAAPAAMGPDPREPEHLEPARRA